MPAAALKEAPTPSHRVASSDVAFSCFANADSKAEKPAEKL